MAQTLEQTFPDLWAEYELGDLFAADFQGVLKWVIRQGSTYYLGDTIGGVFNDMVLAAYNTLPLNTVGGWV